MTPLYAELNRWMPLTYRWGWTDCVTLCGDWVKTICGVDPAADVRGTYESAAECQRVTRFFTDPIGAVSPHLERAGLEIAPQPRAGDVGVILLPLDGRSVAPHMAVCLGRKWAFKSVDGGVTSVIPYKVAAAWGVGYENP